MCGCPPPCSLLWAGAIFGAFAATGEKVQKKRHILVAYYAVIKCCFLVVEVVSLSQSALPSQKVVRPSHEFSVNSLVEGNSCTFCHGLLS